MDKPGPLPPATFLVLLALTGGDRHGYGIMQDVRKLDPAFELGPATLYTTIQRLLDGEWIKEVSGPDSGERRRRYYRITKDGNSVLQAELQRMESMVRKGKSMRLRSAGAAL
ncbi:MAG TPA: helix-turn-helix transcriptional regulator [Bryobacteraceae bacterium]|jgi:DNA-binding PadR family transcriptional regulator|nr:helix-turn-helix transcriptional regulator [Bryobacteraceae bacterium]